MRLPEPQEPMRIQKMIYVASECRYPGGTLTLEGSLPVNGAILRSPWFDAKTADFCTWIKVPNTKEGAAPGYRKSIFHVFASDADIPERLTYANSTEIDGQTFHLLFEIL
jgi:hypothetical protein